MELDISVHIQRRLHRASLLVHHKTFISHLLFDERTSFSKTLIQKKAYASVAYKLVLKIMIPKSDFVKLVLESIFFIYLREWRPSFSLASAFS